ncbi:HAUS augmin-like complex subunit 1 [Limulus polyphemus]|uniref:HAUS augmin-like complex subunit 1 n=1 Tax=Limulus polyphemus TaxID=6850 RepID=A0ABM1TSR5_LIMPO|nr:HAUS augmin-like complex subunit 1 [Limulus polyphemus]
MEYYFKPVGNTGEIPEGLHTSGTVTQVNTWLMEVFNGDQVPLYELSETTISYLETLMNTCRERNQNMRLLLENMRHFKTEYIGERKHVSDILYQCGISVENLPQSTQLCVQALAATGVVLDVKIPSLTCLLYGLATAQKDVAKTIEDCSGEERNSRIREIKYKNAWEKTQQLKSDLVMVNKWDDQQKPHLSKKAEQTEFLRNKVKEYKQQIKQFQDSLQRRGWNRNLNHQELVKTSEELNKYNFFICMFE